VKVAAYQAPLLPPGWNDAFELVRGAIAVYRKRHPAINRSVYAAGTDTPLFTIGGLTFGVIICNDSNHPELARDIAAGGAHALFVPSDNGLARAFVVIAHEAIGVEAEIAAGPLLDADSRPSRDMRVERLVSVPDARVGAGSIDRASPRARPSRRARSPTA
jgi:predicted amidohydrolase